MTAILLSSFPEYEYIILAVLFTLAILVVFVLCACHGEKDSKVEDYGIPGRLSSIVLDAPTTTLSDHCNNLPAENGSASNGKLNGDAGTDENEDLKFRTVVERALPDIPNGGPPPLDTDTDQTPDSGSECYATVTNKLMLNDQNVIPKDLSLIGNPDILENHNSQSSSNNEGITKNDTVVASSESTSALKTCHKYSHVQKPHHPYARLSNQLDSDPGTDDYDESQSSDREKEKGFNYGGTAFTHSLSKSNFDNDMSSPSSSSIGPSSDEARPNSLIAGQAVAGNIPSAEIPYMTPPLADQPTNSHNLPTTFVENAVAQREVPYTVISVREPLERVRMQTQKLRKRQQSNQGSSLDEPEGYYMEVPDEEQTYAEIESGPNSGESSTTYDHIEPRNPGFPPDPPTVESLKSVAQAHSRQASIASMSSFGSAGGDGQSSTKDVNALYSVVDKSDKLNTAVPDSPKFDKRMRQDSNVDELYAKVQKKRAGGTMSVSLIEDVLRVEGADEVFLSSERDEQPPALPPVSGRLHASSLFEPNIVRMLARRHSAEIGCSSKDVTNDSDPGYTTVKLLENNFSANQKIKTTMTNDSDDPGYERIRRETELEEPGYEFIRNNHFIGDGSDPGYESVANMNLSSAIGISRKDSDIGSVVDPGYERVKRHRKADLDINSDPEYECVKFSNKTDSGTDPDYEGVKFPFSPNNNESTNRFEIFKNTTTIIQSELDAPETDSGSGPSGMSDDTEYESTKGRTRSTNSSDIKMINLADELNTDTLSKKSNSILTNEHIVIDKKLLKFGEDGIEGLNGETEDYSFCKTHDGMPKNHNAGMTVINENQAPLTSPTPSDKEFDFSSGSRDIKLESQDVSDYLNQSSSESGIIVRGEKISIRINCSNSNMPHLPKSEPLEVLSVYNNATNLMLGGVPSIHTLSSERFSDNGLEDGSLEVQSNQDYETASSGGSSGTISSRYSSSVRRSINSSVFCSEGDSSKDLTHVVNNEEGGKSGSNLDTE